MGSPKIGGSPRTLRISCIFCISSGVIATDDIEKSESSISPAYFRFCSGFQKETEAADTIWLSMSACNAILEGFRTSVQDILISVTTKAADNNGSSFQEEKELHRLRKGQVSVANIDVCVCRIRSTKARGT